MSILDQTIRETAWRSYDRNVVVLASAGTGKTSLLVERLLNQIVETGLSLRRTAAITFTEKAAAEMLERLQRGLNELARPGGPQSDDGEAVRVWPGLRERLGEEAVRARAGAALDELPLASISTIHAFCARLLRQYGTPLGIPPDFRVDEGFGYEDLNRLHRLRAG